MNKISILAAGVCAAACGAAVLAAPAAPPPIANYWVDAATSSGFGAGMMGGGGRPNMAQMMNMMSGNAPSYAHTLELRLASKTKAPAAPSDAPPDASS